MTATTISTIKSFEGVCHITAKSEGRPRHIDGDLVRPRGDDRTRLVSHAAGQRELLERSAGREQPHHRGRRVDLVDPATDLGARVRVDPDREWRRLAHDGWSQRREWAIAVARRARRPLQGAHDL